MNNIDLISNGYQQHEVYCADSMELLDKVEADIIYLDPPYNQRQY
ncbi:MAG TPA: DNA methyltransferase, partial [Acholeplasmataceae bacterium]|nr:DNA methyltransferase [Acholeplasmataceae bacterium]